MTDRLPLGRHDLLASFYTLSGAPNGRPARHTFDARTRAAGLAGFSAIGMTHFDLEALTSAGNTLDRLAAIAADHGVTVAEVETLAFEPVLTDGDRAAARRLFDAAAAFNGRHVNVMVNLPPSAPVDLDQVAAGFAELCDLAVDYGLLVAFEFMPFKAVSTLDMAVAITERAGRNNGGLVLDTYHFFRGGHDLESLDKLRGQQIWVVQLSDAPHLPPADLLAETRTRRLLPGHGDLPLEPLIRRLDALGSDAVMGVEVLSDDLRALNVDLTAAATAEATRTVLQRARA